MEFIEYAFAKYPDNVIEMYFGKFNKESGGSYYLEKELFDKIQQNINEKDIASPMHNEYTINIYKDMLMRMDNRAIKKKVQECYCQSDNFMAVSIKCTRVSSKKFPNLSKYDDTQNLSIDEYDSNGKYSICFITETVDDDKYYYIKLIIKENINVENIIDLIINNIIDKN